MKKNKYQPELGQQFFGIPYNELKVTYDVEAALGVIRTYMELNSKDKYTPFDNSGMRFKNDVFECNAHSWSECWCEDECTCGHIEQEYNFKWKDFEVSWYKYFGRGMSMNKQISKEKLLIMIEECINSLKNKKWKLT